MMLDNSGSEIMSTNEGAGVGVTRRWCPRGSLSVRILVLLSFLSVEGQFRPDYTAYGRPRILDGRMPYENRFPGIDLEKRIKEDGDSRCSVFQYEHLPLTKSVVTDFGTYEGKI